MIFNPDGSIIDLKDTIIRYCDDVIDSKIIACQKHKWACMRFQRDLERMNKWEWFFNEEKANYYLKWMSLFPHSKGPLAGQKKIPVDYEMFVYANIYGWVHHDTSIRRFRKSYEQLARKNAKSQDKAIQALFECSALGEAIAEVYVAATKKEQTRHVWGEAVWLFKNSEFLKDKFTCKFDQELQQTVIRHKKSGSFFSRLSKDDKKTGDGTNPHFMVIDEYHLHETTEYYDLATSGQKTRAQPLLSIITTAGFDLNNPCYRVEYDYISKILDPNNPIENDRYFAIVCEADKNDTSETIEINGQKISPGGLIDNITSLEAMIKSNPIIGTCAVGVESIKIEIAEALDKPEKMRDVLTKTLNVWVNQRNCGYMPMDKWAVCSMKDPIDVKKMPVVAGFDLSATIDLTSIAFEIPLDDERYFVMSHSFMPEETIEAKRKTDKVPYDLWVSQGWITATPGAEVDYHLIIEYMEKKYEDMGWDRGEVCFDKALATWLTHELIEREFTAIEVPQSFMVLSSPTKDFRAKVYNKKIIHENNPVLTWAISNAVTRSGPSENIMLDKSRAKQRIDPIAAMINAHYRAMVKENNFIYNERGMRNFS